MVLVANQISLCQEAPRLTTVAEVNVCHRTVGVLRQQAHQSHMRRAILQLALTTLAATADIVCLKIDRLLAKQASLTAVGSIKREERRLRSCKVLELPCRSILTLLHRLGPK